MKFFHLSDLHLGIRLREYSLWEDQEDILGKLLKLTDEEKPDAILIAGDVYDKSVPSTEAVVLFDKFLVQLAARRVPAFIISGNHDSAERLAFGNRLIDASGIHLCAAYHQNVEKYVMKDNYGDVNIFMLPFIKPGNVRRYYPDETINTYTDALRAIIKHMNIDKTQRNILIAHQFITGALRSDSENITVGGVDNVDVSVFEDFDYVALGHIHGPQNTGSARVRYCGSPLKYSFSEANQCKSVSVVELMEKKDGEMGRIEVHEIPLVPLHGMVELKGKYNELTLKSYYDHTTYREDYCHITLTDDEDIPDAIGKLRVIYPRLLKLDYDNNRTRNTRTLEVIQEIERESPLDLFARFYKDQNGQAMSDEQYEFMESIIEAIEE